MNAVNWADLAADVAKALGETAAMVGIALVFTVLIGLPVGVLLVVLDRGGVLEAPFGSRRLGAAIHAVLGFVVNVGRSLPFIILMVAILPFTKLLVGRSFGLWAAVVPLTVAAIPFFARLVEIAVREVDRGLVEAAVSLGKSKAEIIAKVLVPESLPAIVLGLFTSVISLLNYSAMAGVIGGGGLGDLALREGYQRYNEWYMLVVVVLLVVIVQALQSLGSALARRVRHDGRRVDRRQARARAAVTATG